MTILDVIIILVIGLCAMSAYKKGFLRSAFNLVAFFLAWFLVRILHPIIFEFLLETPIYYSLKEWVITQLSISEQINQMGHTVVDQTLDALPVTITFLPNINISNFLDIYSLEQHIAATLLGIIIYIISLVVLFIIILSALRFVAISLKLFNKIPIVGPINKCLGGVLGVFFGVILCWIGFVIYIFVDVRTGSDSYNILGSSTIALWLYQNNMLVYLALQLF